MLSYLYLFTIQNITCGFDTRNYAFISKQKQSKLEKLEEGSITGFFNDFGLEKDIITNKRVIPFLDETFNKIITNYKNNIKVIKDNEYYWCIIDDKQIEIKYYPCEYYPCEDWKKTYDHVGIYV